MILAVLIEIATTDLTSIWFAVGSFFAVIANLFLHNDYIAIQVIIFAVVSILTIFLLRPIFRKKIDCPKIPTNVDALIGKMVIVVSNIELNKPGIIKTEGIEWSAITNNDSFVVGDLVEVVSISGNTLLVQKRKEDKK